MLLLLRIIITNARARMCVCVCTYGVDNKLFSYFPISPFAAPLSFFFLNVIFVAMRCQLQCYFGVFYYFKPPRAIKIYLKYKTVNDYDNRIIKLFF